jgi:hypothetical protein
MELAHHPIGTVATISNAVDQCKNWAANPKPLGLFLMLNGRLNV